MSSALTKCLTFTNYLQRAFCLLSSFIVRSTVAVSFAVQTAAVSPLTGDVTVIMTATTTATNRTADAARQSSLVTMIDACRGRDAMIASTIAGTIAMKPAAV